MLNASHDAESQTSMRRPIVNASCPARAGAYILRGGVLVTERKQTVRVRNGKMSWTNEGVGSLGTGAFFVPMENEAADNTAAVKQ